MKKVGFIGASDKTDLIIYIARTLELVGKSVLVVDTTTMQKTRYVVPSIIPTRTYITDFDNVDYAIGFESEQELTRYLGMKDGEELDKTNYDFILIDIDKEETIEQFGIEEESCKNFYVTSFDIYSLKRGMEILNSLSSNIKLSKILMNYNMKKEDEEYLNYLTMDKRVTWNDFTIYVPLLDENRKIIEDNQRVYKARIKRLISEYQDSIIYIAQNIIEDISANKIKKIIKEKEKN